MGKTDPETVQFTGAPAGATLIGSSKHNKGILVQVQDNQEKTGQRIQGEFVLLDAGEGEYAEALSSLVGHQYASASELIDAVRRKPGSEKCTHIVNRNSLKVATETPSQMVTSGNMSQQNWEFPTANIDVEDILSQLIEFLSRLENIHTSQKRRALVQYMGFGHLSNQIDWMGSNIVFVSGLLDLILQEGRAEFLSFLATVAQSGWIGGIEHRAQLKQLQESLASLTTEEWRRELVESRLGRDLVVLPSKPIVSSSGNIGRDYQYQVALSFAGEDRFVARKFAKLLKDNDIRVFYDEYEQADLWGKDLYRHLTKVYKEYSEYCVIFVSENYSHKLWTQHELQQAQARAFLENREFILPIRLDNTEIPGIPETVSYLDINTVPLDQIAQLLMTKLESHSFMRSTVIPNNINVDRETSRISQQERFIPQGKTNINNSVATHVVVLDIDGQEVSESLAFAQIRDVLAKFYPDETGARRVVDDAGLNASNIAFNPRAKDNWHTILQEAQKTNQINALLDIVKREYGNNEGLMQVIDTYRKVLSHQENPDTLL